MCFICFKVATFWLLSALHSLSHYVSQLNEVVILEWFSNTLEEVPTQRC